MHVTLKVLAFLTAVAILFGVAAVLAISTPLPGYGEEVPTPTPTLETPAEEYPEALPLDPLPEVVPVPAPGVLPTIQEDDPAWDCRINGNEVCGVLIEGTWYLVQFEDGAPVGVTVR